MATEDNYTPTIKRVAQYGLFSKGIVYIFFSLVLLMAIYGHTQHKVDLYNILDNILLFDWYGPLVVMILGTGLISYASWKFFQMFFNTEGLEKNRTGYFIRASWIGPLIFHLGFGLHVWQRIFRWMNHEPIVQSTAINTSVYDSTGRLILIALTIMFLANAGTLFYLAFTGKCRLMLTGSNFFADEPKLAFLTGFLGYFFYGLALLIISILFIMALIFYNSDYAEGTDSMLDILRQHRLGRISLLVIAFGTACYGTYFLLTVFYRFRHIKS